MSSRAELAHALTPTAPAAGAAVPARHFWTKLFYGSGSLAFGVKDNGFNVLLLLYYNQVLGLSAGVAGAVVALALIVDSVLDPITGYLSDNLHSRWGRRHPFMYAAAVPAALSYLLLWNPPAGLSQTGLAVYLFFVAVLVRSFITLYEIPSAALGPELTEDYDERTSYMGYRYLFGWIGGITMYILAFALFLKPDADHALGQLNPAGYHNYGLAASATMFVSILISSIGTHSAIKRLKPPALRRRIPLSTAFREIVQALGNPSSLALLGAGAMGFVSSGIFFALQPYFNTYFWGLSSQNIALLGAAQYLSAFGAMMLAPVLSRRLGKKRAAILVAICTTILTPVPYVCGLLGLLRVDDLPVLMPVLFVYNVVVVGLSIVPPILVSSMISDVVEDNQLKTGRRSEGVLFAANAFLLKCGSGLGLAGAAFILSVAHFPQKAVQGRVTPEVLRDLALTYLAAISVMYVIYIVFVGRYRITREVHVANLLALAEKARAADPDNPPMIIPTQQ